MQEENRTGFGLLPSSQVFLQLKKEIINKVFNNKQQ